MVVVAVCLALLRGSLWWAGGSAMVAIMLMLLRRLGGVWYWGGARCTRCGATEMYR
jgi:hypothetical protein